ncbi:MAG TPA: hypothetical protein VGS19_00085 [Streptosporangiaceae bacterium]|nr:hypothetical protein [Streptosporangiaceae bacterium]
MTKSATGTEIKYDAPDGAGLPRFEELAGVSGVAALARSGWKPSTSTPAGSAC